MKSSNTTHFQMPLTVWALGWVSLLTDVSTEMIYPLLPFSVASLPGARAPFLGLMAGAAETTAAILKLVADRMEGWEIIGLLLGENKKTVDSRQKIGVRSE